MLLMTDDLKIKKKKNTILDLYVCPGKREEDYK